MLTTSPIISSSSNNASPRSFGAQYGPTARSPHQQGNIWRSGPVSLPRRQSRMSSQTQSSSNGGSNSMTSSLPSNQNDQNSRQTSFLTSPAPALAPESSADRGNFSAQPQPRPRPHHHRPIAPNLSQEKGNTSTAPIPAGSNPLDDPQRRQQVDGTEVAAASAASAMSSTLSTPKRPNPTDNDDNRGQRSTVGPLTRPARRPRQSEVPPKRVPQLYEHCSVDDMVILISHMVVELIETNDNLSLRPGSLTRFHSRTTPGISVLDYLNRLAKHATLTPPLLLSMVYYIDRLCALYPQFTINTLTVHRFLITAATVAAKGLSDSFWNNTTYAKVGGVRVQELNLLELEFLYRVDWKIVPNPDVLVAYYKGLIERHPGYELLPAPNQNLSESPEDGDLGDSDSDSDEISDGSPGPTGSADASMPG